MQRTDLKVAFLDRDGVINEDSGYVYQPKNFVFCEGVFDALHAILAAGYFIIIITNQAGIGRGYYSVGDYEKLTNWYERQFLDSGISILDIMHCPHHPTAAEGLYRVVCKCRKPGPELILQAARHYTINIRESFFVGDKHSDILAAKGAGLRNAVFLSSWPEKFANSHTDLNFLTFDSLLSFTTTMEKDGWFT